MTFSLNNLSPNTSYAKNDVPSIFTFFNKDSDTVTTAGFIPFNAGTFKTGDLVLVIAADSSSVAWYKVSVNSSTRVITLTAL